MRVSQEGYEFDCYTWEEYKELMKIHSNLKDEFFDQGHMSIPIIYMFWHEGFPKTKPIDFIKYFFFLGLNDTKNPLTEVPKTISKKDIKALTRIHPKYKKPLLYIQENRIYFVDILKDNDMYGDELHRKEIDSYNEHLRRQGLEKECIPY